MAIAIVTGASAGFGWEFARQLDSEGLDEIWLIARRKERLETLAAELTTPCKVLPCDLMSGAEINRVIAPVLKEEQPVVRYCINNAGFGKVGPLSELDKSAMLDMVDLNCKAVVHLTHLVIPCMETGGAFIHTSSMAGAGPLGGFAVYGATKAFVTSFSMAIEAELKERGIHSIAICPGPTKTEFSKVAHNGSTRSDSVFNKKDSVEDVVRKALKDTKEKRSISLFGLKNHFLYWLSRMLPAYVVSRLSYRTIMKTPKKRLRDL